MRLLRRALMMALVAGAALGAGKGGGGRRPGGGGGAAGTAAVTVTPTQAGPGQITFATASSAFFDRGSADGLAVGTALNVTRGGKSVGKCNTTTVADHWATCVGEGLRPGDRLSVIRTGPDVLPPAPAAPPSLDELRRRGQALEAKEIPLVDFDANAGGISAGRRVSVALSHTTWGNLASGNGPFQVQRLDVGLYDFQLYQGLHASADLSVLTFSSRPDNHQSPLGGTGSVALVVRQAELSFRAPGIPFVGAVGRTNTRYTPGLLVLDGAQAGYRSARDDFEAGAYGGLLPQPYTLTPSPRRWTAGAYLMARAAKGKGQDSSLFQVEAHLGYAVRAAAVSTTPDVGARLELGVALYAWLTRSFDAHLDLQLGMLSSQAPGLVDGARLDVGWRPSDRFRLFLNGRYQGQVNSEVLELGATVPGQRAIHAELGATYELTQALWVGLNAGTAIDLTSALSQTHVGPDVTFPSLFGRVGGLSLGYQEELGWLRGRSGWLQLNFTPVNRLRVFVRGSWFQQQLVDESAGVAQHEAGASLSADWAINRYLWVRLSGLFRSQLASSNPGPATPSGGSVMGQIGGQL